MEEIKNGTSVWVRECWQRQLEDARLYGERTRLAIRPHIDAWLDRGHGALTFHVTQILTGYGCFGSYLRRIGKAHSAQCSFCGTGDDTAEHTLQACEAWEAERGDLVAVIGEDLSLPAMVGAITESSDA
ncbi:uncharacterized protein [Temnothorax nylanderi]|uniref:uncharacterized protein n=1 Tax=Temnothorax nylanderi TaxID=102681 RepID=UPI003A8C2140